jgi:DNA-binding PadR family transcriptional regulator
MPRKRPDEDAEIREGLRNLSKLLGHRVRLGICVLLARNDELSFSRLKELVEESDGNLGAQLRKLEDESFISVRKEFRNRRPVTWYSLTDYGREGLDEHLNALAQLLGE